MNDNSPIRLMKPNLGDEELQAVKEVLDSGFLTEGPRTLQFEKEIASYVGAKHGIAATSCTTAIELALRCCGVGAGDEVLVPDFTYPATADAVLLVGATPVLVDVDETTYNVRPDQIEKAMTARTKAVIPVSLFGHAVDSQGIKEVVGSGVKVIEDAACSMGASLGKAKVGNLADASCFSFHPRKVLTTGEGGMVTTNDDDLATRIRRFKRFGMETREGRITFTGLGTNYKLSDVNSAIGLVQLKRLERTLEKRRERARIYDELLENVKEIVPPSVPKTGRHSFQSYAVRLVRSGVRDRTIVGLKTKGIETQVGTYSLCEQPAFASLRKVGRLETSRKLAESLLALPLHSELTQEEQERVIHEVVLAVNSP